MTSSFGELSGSAASASTAVTTPSRIRTEPVNDRRSSVIGMISAFVMSKLAMTYMLQPNCFPFSFLKADSLHFDGGELEWGVLRTNEFSSNWHPHLILPPSKGEETRIRAAADRSPFRFSLSTGENKRGGDR